MSTAAAYGNAGRAVFIRDLRIFLTYRNRVIAELLSVVFTVTVFYYIAKLVRVEQFPEPGDYFAFSVVGIVIFRSLISAYGSFSGTLRQEMVAGTFERMVASPFGPTAGTLSMALFPFAYSAFMATITISLAALLFGVPLAWSTLPLAVGAGLLTVLAFAPFAFLIGASVIVFKQTAGSGLILAVMGLVSGIVFPVELLPSWMQWAAEVQPFTPAVDLLRHLIVDTPLQDPAWVSLLKVVGFTLVLLPLSIWVVSRAIDLGRRRATLIEY